MQVFHSKSFDKQFAKLPVKLQEAYIARNRLFMENRRHVLLHDHALTDRWSGHRSINITGDYRATYREISPDTFLFVAIGTHHDLYGT
ncbi:MAG: hypothetical protein AAB947_00460 [Patescibacteria group bacterium]